MREQFTDWDSAKANEAAALLDEISDHIVPALGGADAARTPLTEQRHDPLRPTPRTPHV